MSTTPNLYPCSRCNNSPEPRINATSRLWSIACTCGNASTEQDEITQAAHVWNHHNYLPDCWMLTHSAQVTQLIDPTPEMINPDDIAHALSNLCRFNGHTNQFYSVAQHSVLVSQNVPQVHALAGLLHDATEAYLSDVISPVKPYPLNYQAIEDRLWHVIAERFDLSPTLPQTVKLADLRALAAEKRDVMPQHDKPWPTLNGITPFAEPINPLPPTLAKQQWTDRFQELTNA